MSKSRGNVVDPLVWIDTYGADAVRLSLLQGANPGADQAINEEWVEGALPADLDGANAWIVSRLNRVVAQVDALYERYEFAKVVDLLYHFAWDEVCDWYLELAKVALSEPDAAPTTRRVLGEVLDTLLRLLHPLTPFVTEALWTALTGGESLVIADWPRSDESRIDPGAESEIEALQAVVNEVRRFRSDQGLRPSQPIPARITALAGQAQEVRTLLRLTEPADGFTATASLTTGGGVRVEFDLSGTVDIGAERARLAKDLVSAMKERDVNTAKLGNDSFTGKAPDAVVAKVRDRLSAAHSDIERIEAALAALPSE